MIRYGQKYNPRAAKWATARAFGRYNRKAAPSLDPARRALYPMPAGTREPVTIAGRPWERVWRSDGTYECVPVREVPPEVQPLRGMEGRFLDVAGTQEVTGRRCEALRAVVLQRHHAHVPRRGNG